MFGISGKIAIAEFIIMLLMGGVGFVYYHFTEQTIINLNIAKAQLETAVSTQKETIAAQTAAAEKQNTAMLALQQSRDESEAGRRTLEDLLQKHDLAAIARKNSSALEIRINRATDKVFTDIEQLTSPSDRPAPVVTKPVTK